MIDRFAKIIVEVTKILRTLLKQHFDHQTFSNRFLSGTISLRQNFFFKINMPRQDLYDYVNDIQKNV